jgi:hypothetical protein
VNITEQSWALNFLVLATELKLLIFKISARTFLTITCEQKEIQRLDSFSSRKKNGK